jgi:hypothetical protein
MRWKIVLPDLSDQAEALSRRHGAVVSSILPYITNETFSPTDIETLSGALDDVCLALKISEGAVAREVIAVRIVELARRGERDRRKLAERLVTEANGRSLNGAT